MWFTRIWIVLLAAAAGGTLSLALVAPRPSARELARTSSRSLDRVQHNAEMLLKQSARAWIDKAASLASDATLAAALSAASKGAKDIKPLTAKIKSRVLGLLSQLKPENQPKLVIAVDFRGKQICRIGPGESKVKLGVDGLAGYPIFEAALRGFQLDDTWDVDGSLFLVAAAPVISRKRGVYVGALLLGQKVDALFAAKLKGRLAEKKTDVAFFLRGSMVASTVSSPELKKLPQRYDKLRTPINNFGRSKVVSVGAEPKHSVVMATMAGEAALHDAFYAVVGPPPSAPAGLGEALDAVDWDKDMAHFPWLLVIGMAFALAIVGVVLTFVEGSRPASRLIDALQTIAKGDATRLDAAKHAGTSHYVALAINDVLDRQAKRAPAPSSVAARDINQILGSPEEAATSPDLRLEPSATTMPPLAQGVQPLSTLDGNAGQPSALPTLKPMMDDPAPIARVDEEDKATTVDSSPRFEENLPLLSPVSLPEDDAPVAKPTPPPQSAAPELAPLAPLAPPSGRAGGDANAAAMASAPEPESPEDPHAGEAYFKQIYKDFLTIKRQCGESTDNITFDRFANKLRKNRSNLIERYSCKSVKFQVYVKDGKAALKATPIKE